MEIETNEEENNQNQEKNDKNQTTPNQQGKPIDTCMLLCMFKYF